jgi:SPP1 gp7 family putative phage head morphogenesis protein
LHELYSCDCPDCVAHQNLADNENDFENNFKTDLNELSKSFQKAAEIVYSKKNYNPEMLNEPEFQDLISATYKVLSKSVKNISIKQEIPDEFTSALNRNTFMFSGFKNNHTLNQVNNLLKDEKGEIKQYYKFEQEVLKLDAKYNKNYLEAEYDLAEKTCEAAAKWKDFVKDGDRYYLQYRTAGDDKVREEHAILNKITLPVSDSFWDSYFPPNGYRCRCTVIQVRKVKYEESDSEESLAKGNLATTQRTAAGQNKAAIFRFNPGKQEVVFPPKHPYYKLADNAQKSTLTNILTEQFDNTVKAENKLKIKEYKEILNDSLIDKKVTQTIKVKNKIQEISIGFRKEFNKHIAWDLFGSSKGIIPNGDIPKINELLETAKFVKVAKLYKRRKDDIKRFYYYKNEIGGKTVYFQVAETNENKSYRWNKKRYLYTITKKLPKKKNVPKATYE